VRRSAASGTRFPHFHGNATGTVTFSGLPIRDGFTNDEGAGIDINTSTVNVSNCVLTNNFPSRTPWDFRRGQGGRNFQQAGTVSVSNSVITGNRGASGGGGIFNDSGGTVNISQSLISFNRSWRNPLI